MCTIGSDKLNSLNRFHKEGLLKVKLHWTHMTATDHKILKARTPDRFSNTFPTKLTQEKENVFFISQKFTTTHDPEYH